MNLAVPQGSNHEKTDIRLSCSFCKSVLSQSSTGPSYDFNQRIKKFSGDRWKNMLFTSLPFLLIFLPTVLFGYYFCIMKFQAQSAKVWLFLSSLFFYAYWDIRFLPLLMGSILFNFLCGNFIFESAKEPQRILGLLLGIIANISLLFYFKYYNFFVSIVATDAYQFDELLPLGISFYTFTQIAFLVDAYYRKTERSGLVPYCLFVTVFPHMIAGPILHHKQMISQFNNSNTFAVSWKNISKGIFLFTLGLSKKILIADQIAIYVKPVFDHPDYIVPFFQAWMAAISYSLQLYFDFSGYSDMAVGLGLMFNMYLPINFNSPYKADSIIDFWRRWHITLSHFLRDYLYIPFGGNHGKKWKMFRNLALTMIIGGIWHGAGFTFILWGAMHGAFLIINHLFRSTHLPIPRSLSKFLTLFAVVCGWVMFRSSTVSQAMNIFSGMIGLNGIILPKKYETLLQPLAKLGVQFLDVLNSNFKAIDMTIIGLLFACVLLLPNSNDLVEKFENKPKFFGIPCAVLVFLMLIYLTANESKEFLYYTF